MTHQYKLKYKIEIEDRDKGYKPEDADEEHGLTDALAVFSIIYPEDGSYSQCIALTADGREKRPLSQDEIFKLWMTLGLSLSQSEKLSEGKKELAKHFAELVRDIFKK